jgi:hypothetical protein
VETISSTQQLCPFCSSPIDSTAFFCPVCGKKLKEKPLATGIWTQIGIYLVSVLLPPLFIGWTIKYLKSSDPKAKQVGVISLILTVLVLIITIWVSLSLITSLTQQLYLQVQQYQNAGF